MRRLLQLLLVLICIGIGAELTCRYVVGLGDPPLTRIDPEIEYLFAPSRCYQRLGRTICYNSVSMRAQEPPPPGDATRRILVLGDSVINGGVLTDQAQLATTILHKALGPQVWVGHISAGSWGPANLAAYTRRFGWFNTDLSILVLSSHDLTDLPEFRASYGIDFPTTPPRLAIEEAVLRYGPRVLPVLGALSEQATPPRRAYTAAERNSQGRAALVDFLRLMQANSKSAYVVLYPTAAEFQATARPERSVEIEEIERLGLPYIDLIASKAWSRSYYRDDIHPNAEGQAALARIFQCLWEGNGAACAP